MECIIVDMFLYFLNLYLVVVELPGFLSMYWVAYIISNPGRENPSSDRFEIGSIIRALLLRLFVSDFYSHVNSV